MKRNIHEKGITLIALVITIIVLVILAAVTLNSIFGNNIIGIAINGAMGYAEEQQKELGMLNNVSGILSDFLGDSNKPMAPSVTLVGTKGNNDIYTSDVTANISINRGLETTGTIKLHYSLSGAKTQEEQVAEEDVSIQITEEGTTTITAWTENDKGNLSDKVETVVTINKTAPSSPMISLNGTEGENGYYTTDVRVTITAGEASNIASIKYKVEGANPIAETESAGNGDVTFDITQDGKSTVTAYIINNAGLTSETITQVVNKDSTNPSTATIALSGEAGETNINVSATGEDATSGVASYAFQISTTGNENDFQTADTVQNTTYSCTFNYEGLTSNTTYYLRIVVKDKAGNMTKSTIINGTTKTAELTEEELASDSGKYVEYKSENGSFISKAQYSGYDTDQNFTTDTSVKWKILFAEGNILTLISDKAVNNGFVLESYNGYNNGVLLLNEACKAMYSNNNIGAIGKSLNIDHIEKVSSYIGPSNTTYSSSYRYYPNIFAQEEGGAPNGTYNGTLKRSEQASYVTGYSSGNSSFRGRDTSYSYTMSTSYMSQSYIDLFKSNIENWLASRCTNMVYSSGPFFQLYSIDGNNLSTRWLYDADNYDKTDGDYAIRPIVEIDLSKVTIGASGDGSSSSPYTITAK